ncbi:phosphonoacetaldehyde hydrolase [uncultured Mediterranea sp.]|uniref:phosphonoacetaldehyde hydrolase n=1 Tax=uncultured Mediterranea sp. TaxID=1926662 RepID=UPI0027D96555|nr:phosphonoacetaldehyde hydrolase [uncultured Mediterranea sp.]
MKKIECVIFDWAGTAVDYGCFAPVAAFVESFNEIGVPVSAADTRRYMGLTKIEEIRALFALEHVSAAFRQKFGRDYNEEDVQGRYAAFQQILFDTLSRYATPIPGVVEAVGRLRAQGIKIGSTTGYTGQMMELVIPAAQAQGYRVDCCVTSDGLPGGRPAPYMIYQNMIRLAVPSADCVVKVGDTLADIGEGVHAKVWTVGVVLGSNELALTRAEVEAMPEAELDKRKADVRRRMLEAGAHYVIDSMDELDTVIAEINRQMNEK